jgi:MFS family permease
MRAVLRRREFRLVYLGMTISLLGDASLLLIPAIHAKNLTGSNGAAGLVLLFFTLPMLFGPAFGLLIDRADRRRVLVATCLLSALAVLPLAAATDEDSFWIVYPVAFGMGLSYTVIFSALTALLKVMLPEDLLAQANGVLTTTRNGLRLVGPVLGVGLYAGVGMWAVIGFDVLSFVVAAAVLAMVRPPAGDTARKNGRLRVELAAGIRHLWSEPALSCAIVALSVMFIVSGATEPLIFAVIEGLGRTPEFVAVTSVAMGVGAIASGLIAARVIDRWGELRVIGIGIAVVGTGLGLWLVPLAGVMVAAMGFVGAGITLNGVSMRTLIQRRSPSEIVGRVSTAYEAVVGAWLLLAVLVGAALVSLIDYRIMVISVSSLCFAGALYTYTSKRRGQSARDLRSPAPTKSSVASR